MQAPSRLPSHLASYETCVTDHELFQALRTQWDDLAAFFEYACEDEPWARQHFKFMRLTLRWAAKSFYLGTLSREDARRLVKTIQNHYSLLQPFLFFRAALFFTVKLQVEGQDVLVNSLLFGVGSPVLARIFRQECFEKLKDEWIVPYLQMSSFRLLETYLYHGQIDLGKYAEDEVRVLMKQAQAWALDELVKACAFRLR